MNLIAQRNCLLYSTETEHSYAYLSLVKAFNIYSDRAFASCMCKTITWNTLMEHSYDMKLYHCKYSMDLLYS